MSIREKTQHFSFCIQLHHADLHNRRIHRHAKRFKAVPKGCVAILVGRNKEQQQRFVVPLIYINHPLFMQLLKVAEEEYGFDHAGPIAIPCQVEEFRHVRGLIDSENSSHHVHHYIGCFNV